MYHHNDMRTPLPFLTRAIAGIFFLILPATATDLVIRDVIERVPVP